MGQTFEGKARAAVLEVSEEDGLKYLEELKESWRDISKNLSRSGLFYLLIIGLFELLIGSKEDLRATIAGFQFTNSDTLQKVLPVVAGYLFYDTVVLAWRWSECEDVFRVFCQKFCDSLYRWDMEILLKPSSGIVNVGARYAGEGLLPNFGRIGQIIIVIVVLLALPVAFLGQSAWLLTQKFGWGDPLVLISISLSGVFTAYGLIYSYLVLIYGTED